MKVEIEVPKHVAEKVAEILVKYHEEECQGDCMTGLEERDGRVCLELSTGNKWCADVKNGRIAYEGSRYGWHAQTPFGDSDVTIYTGEVFVEESDGRFWIYGTEPSVADACDAYRALREGRAFVYVNVGGETVRARIVRYESSAPGDWCLMPNELVATLVTRDGRLARAAIPAKAAESIPWAPFTGRLLCVGEECPEPGHTRLYDNMLRG